MSKSWVFTINNYTDEDTERCHLLKELANTVYCSYEKAPTTGTPHIQGYVTFKKSKRLKGVSNLLPRARLEKAKGDRFCNRTYIIDGRNTDGSPKEVSAPFICHEQSAQGARNDLKAMYEMARVQGVKRTAEEFTSQYGTHHKGIRAYLNAIAKPRDRYPTVWWIYGPTGVGKSMLPYSLTEISNVYQGTMAHKGWFDGFDNHDWVILNELDKRDIPAHVLLNLMDIYPHQVECKGSSINFNANNIYITSSTHPRNMYPQDIYEQVYRRINFLGEKSNFNSAVNWEKWSVPTNESLADIVAKGQFLEPERVAQLTGLPGVTLSATVAAPPSQD